MSYLFRLFIISSIFFVLSACSTSNLQSTRMDKAEEQIVLAEQALNQSNKSVASQSIGTASAYLATVTDFINSLNDRDKGRLKRLKQKVDIIERRTRLLP